MAYCIHPDRTVTTFTWTDIDDVQKRVGGSFDCVPYQIGAGYLVLVNDCGLLDQMPRNPAVEELTGYPEVYGPAVVASFEESGEDEILHRIRAASRVPFETRLYRIVSSGSPRPAAKATP